MKLELKELIEGSIYYNNGKSYNYEYIFVYRKVPTYMGYGNYIELSSKYLGESGFNSYQDMKDIRVATSQESQWLEACIKAKKFIPLDQVELNIESYQIY